MTTTMASNYVVLAEGEGLRLQSGPGRDLIFKVTGEDTGGASDTFSGTCYNRQIVFSVNLPLKKSS